MRRARGALGGVPACCRWQCQAVQLPVKLQAHWATTCRRTHCCAVHQREEVRLAVRVLAGAAQRELEGGRERLTRDGRQAARNAADGTVHVQQAVGARARAHGEQPEHCAGGDRGVPHKRGLLRELAPARSSVCVSTAAARTRLWAGLPVEDASLQDASRQLERGQSLCMQSRRRLTAAVRARPARTRWAAPAARAAR